MIWFDLISLTNIHLSVHLHELTVTNSLGAPSAVRLPMPSSHHLKMCHWRTSFRPQDPGNPGGAEITTGFDQFFVLKCHGGYGTGASLRAPLDKESSERRFNRSSNCVCLKMGCSYNPLVSQNPLTIGEEEGLIAILIGLGSLIKSVFFPFSSGRERDIYMYVCMYIYMCIYIYVCVYIYIYTCLSHFQTYPNRSVPFNAQNIKGLSMMRRDGETKQRDNAYLPRTKHAQFDRAGRCNSPV